MSNGHWILLEDLDSASVDVLSSLLPVLKSRSVCLPDGTVLNAHDDFRLFATMRTGQCKSSAHLQNLMSEWFSVDMNPLTMEDMKEILEFLFPNLSSIIGRLLEVYNLLTEHAKTPGSRKINFRDVVKLSRRLNQRVSVCHDSIAVFQESVDCFAASIRQNRLEIMCFLGANLNVSKEKVEYYFACHKPSFEISKGTMHVGRAGLKLTKVEHLRRCRNFAQTRPSLVLLERLSVCVEMNEPVLLVGETGCGKTMTVQVLADCLGKNLHVINMSQQSENADLVGGYKPVDLAHTMKRLKEEYVDLFARTYSVTRNEKFLHHIKACYQTNSWDTLIALMERTTERFFKNNDLRTSKEVVRWLRFYDELVKMRRMLSKSKGGLLFTFVEGILTKAVKNGEWILLDEINLAPPETVDCLNTLLDNQSGNNAPCIDSDRFGVSGFRLFACMNPSTDVGKRELLPGVRNRFTEIFVDECDNVEDLSLLIDDYLRGVPLSNDPSKRSDKIMNIVRFYLAVKSVASSKLAADSWGHFPTFSLRTLCRALQYVRNNAETSGSIIRILFEGFCMSFLTELDRQSYTVVKKMITEFIIGRNPNIVKAALSSPLPKPIKGLFINVQGYWLPKGSEEVEADDKYILTLTVERNLTDVARAVSARLHPVLLQGETSVGKTSLINYLAKLTGNRCVRINNHEHTDLQEYVGSYVSDQDGKLVFTEGPLVQAMKGGYWIILDELNLAPPDILEALNRVLDDNRELFVTETQETIKAHPQFMLFATQNPYGLYGGRKQLSRAFRNRFIELHFDELPHEELERILHLRCQLPLSYARKMVKTMQDLQMFRNSTGLFAGRESYMTLRDLFRWGERYRLANVKRASDSQFFDWDQYLADQGYFLLASRCRRQDDHDTVCNVLHNRFNRTIDHKSLFSIESPYFPFQLDSFKKDFSHVVYTYNLRRLAVLTSQCLLYDEPVLLVGDTGCGKTTLCQMLANHNNKRLHTINCHMMTEASDFMGRVAPASADKMAQGVLFQWYDGPLVVAMRNGEPLLIDEISLADDSVLERLNSVLEPERTLLLSEMGGARGERGGVAESDAVDLCPQVVGQTGFAILATMNPGGDYGKKELSKALRNRFAEIWCDCAYDETDIVAIVNRNLCISDANLRETIGEMIFNFVAWLKNLSIQNSKLVVTIRDILSWVTFMNRCSHSLSSAQAFIHGAFSTFLDGYGVGLNRTTGQNSRKQLIEQSLDFLISLSARINNGQNLYRTEFQMESVRLSWTESGFFGAHPFYIPCVGPVHDANGYCFDAPTCAFNIYKIIRALQLDKPILLEGSPGVGKTSVVQALARSTGHELVRINLSDQTDLSDLFGTDAPITLPNGEHGFAWLDGPLLAAVKAGHWVLIDEMNLASQSVLEGLNACFDHRREIFLPQLGKSFEIDCTKTKFFACQNPYSEGASRKGLPKSFLNRFTTVYIEPLESQDIFIILRQAFPVLDADVLSKMVEFNFKINEEVNVQKSWGQIGGPWEFNLRDLMRWCSMIVTSNREPSDLFNIIYLDRLRCSADKQQMIRCFEQCFDFKYKSPSLDFYCGSDMFSIGTSSLKTNYSPISKNLAENYQQISHVLLRSTLDTMRSAMACIRSNFLTILVGDSGSGKTALIESLAEISGQKLRKFHLTSETDSSDLLGCYEQVFDAKSSLNTAAKIREAWRQARFDLILTCCKEGKMDSMNKLMNLMPLCLDQAAFKDLLKVWPRLLSIASSLESRGSDFVHRLMDLKSSTEGIEQIPVDSAHEGESRSFHFQWVDSPLIEAVRNGDWLLIQNVHFCNPAVLDRLNALLEPDGELTVAEKGIVDGHTVTYKPHQNFRIFFTMQPGHAKSLSRAMRNRGVELFMCADETWFKDPQDCYSILKHKLQIDQDLFGLLWIGMNQLSKAGFVSTASDLIKVAFIAREFRVKRKILNEAVQLAFRIVLRLEKSFDFANDTDANHVLRPYITVCWLRRNHNLLSLHKDISLLEMFMGVNSDLATLQIFMKFFLLGASPSDYRRRLKAGQKFMPEYLSDVSIEKFSGVLKRLVDKNQGQNIAFDLRWSAYLWQHLGVTDSPSWNKSSLFLLFHLALLFTTPANGRKSLLNIIKDALDGRTNPEALPNKSLLFIPGFFDQLRRVVEDQLMDDVSWFNNDWTLVVSGLFFLCRFLCLCNGTVSSINEFWSTNSVELRIVWHSLVKCVGGVFSLAEMCLQLTRQLNERWCVESQLSKAYSADLTHLDIAKPFTSFDHYQKSRMMKQNLTDNNKALRAAFDENNQDAADRLIASRRSLIHSEPSEKMDDLITSSPCPTVNMEIESARKTLIPVSCFAIMRKDVLADLANLRAFVFLDVNKFNSAEFSTEILNQNGQITADVLNYASELSASRRLNSLLSFLNNPIGLQMHANEISGCFKICNLLDLPSISATFWRFISENFTSSGQCLVPLSKIDLFKENLAFFASFVWCTGSILPILDQHIKQEITSCMIHLKHQLKSQLVGQVQDDVLSTMENFGMEMCRRLTPPKNFLDPILKRKIKMNLREDQRMQIERELGFLNFRYKSLTTRALISDDDFEVPAESLHPYVQALMTVKNRLLSKLSTTGSETYYRPEHSLFEALVEELHSFLATVESFANACSVVPPNSSPLDHLTMIIRVTQTFLASADHFVNNITKDRYLVYRDIVEPFSMGVNLLRLVFSRRLISNYQSLKRLESAESCGSNSDLIIQIYKQLMSYNGRPVLDLLIEQNKDVFTIDDQLRVIEFAFVSSEPEDGCEDKIKPYCEKLVNLYVSWSESQQSDDKYYTYKSNESTSVEEQENMQIKSLFPNYDIEIFGEKRENDIEQNVQDTDVHRTEFNHVDETRFVYTLKCLLLKNPYDNRTNLDAHQFLRWFLSKKIASDHLLAMDFAFDCENLDQHLLWACGLSNCFGQNSHNEKSSDKCNVYKDSNLNESGRLRVLLNLLKSRLGQLLSDWPENAVLEEILKSCHRISDLPSQTPIIKLIAALEYLLEEANEWEKVAARHVKLEGNLHPLRQLLIDWRKMEVRGWERLLDDVDEEYNDSALCTLLKFAAVLQSFISGVIDKNDFITAYTNFLAFCPIGEFHCRLKMSRLINSALLDSKSVVSAFCDNLNRYFCCFSERIAQRVSQCRQPVERELKDFIKIVKFQDLNIYRVKETGKHAHRQLFKLVRKYKESLQEPASTYFNEVVPLNERLLSITAEISSCIDNPNIDKIPPERIAGSNAQFLTYFPKFEKFCHEISVSLNTKLEFSEICSEATDLARNFSINLRKSLPYSCCKDEMAENEKIFKRSMQMRRNLLIDLFRCLQLNGLRHRSGLSIEKQKMEDLLFNFEQPANLGDLNTIYCNVDEIFWLAVQRKNLLDDRSIQKMHEQIDQNTLQRCKGYSQAISLILIETRSNVGSMMMDNQHLKKSLNMLSILSQQGVFSNFYDVQNGASTFLRDIYDITCKLEQNFRKSTDIWRCNHIATQKDEFKLDESSDFSPKVSYLDVRSEEFETSLSKLDSLHNSSISLLEQSRKIRATASGNKGFLFGDPSEILDPLMQSAKEMLPDLQSVLTVCTTSACQLNLFNKHLLENLQLLKNFVTDGLNSFNLAYCAEPMTADASKSVDTLLEKIFIGIQKIYKLIDDSSNEQDTDLISEVKKYNQYKQIVNCDEIFRLIDELADGCRINCCKVDPIAAAALQHFLVVQSRVLDGYMKLYVSLMHFYLELLDGWIILLKEGFVQPVPELDGNQNDGKSGDRESKLDDLQDAGMGEGQGAKDVSDQIDDLGQIEGLKGEDRNEQDAEDERSKMDDVEKPIEMEDDFDAQMEDLKLGENDDEESDNDNDETTNEEPDWQKGEAEEPEDEQLDPNLWDNREKEDKAGEEPNLDDEAKGAEKMQDELVAMDEHKVPQSENEEKQPDDSTIPEAEQEETIDEIEEPNLENIDLQDTNPNDEESDSEEMGHEEQKVDETVETPEDEPIDKDKAEELTDQPLPDQSQANDSKSVHTVGGCGSASDQSAEIVQESIADQPHDQKSDDSDQTRSMDKNRQNESNQMNQLDSAKDDAVIDNFSNKRVAEQNISSRDHKRQKVDQQNKSLVDSAQDLENVAEKVDVVEENFVDPATSSENFPSSTFAHAPQIDSGSGTQKAYDSASLELAREQMAQKQESLLGPEDQSVEMELGGHETDTRQVCSQNNFSEAPEVNGYRNEIIQENKTEEDNKKEIPEIDYAKKHSTIHTVLDFYSQASTSQQFFDANCSFDFDLDQYVVDKTRLNEQCKTLWSSLVGITQNLAAELTENLRMTLEPTIASKYQGDYRTGKRLNIRKLIPYIASYYRKNKIWLRRTKKAKRDYQIMLAIDDSSSMNDNRTKQLAFESLALLSNALRYLEAGQLAVCKFGNEVQLLHPFYEPFDDDRGATTIGQLNFDQKQTNIVPLIEFSTNYFELFAKQQSASTNSDLPAQLMLIISDGRGIFAQGMEKVKLAVQKATGRRIFMVFIVLDNPDNKDSIVDIKLPVFRESGPPDIKSYMEFFPFSFYVILRRIGELPAVLGDALRQWFEILSCEH